MESGSNPGALHLPQDDLADRLDEIDPQRRLVRVFRSGNRSACHPDPALPVDGKANR